MMKIYLFTLMLILLPGQHPCQKFNPQDFAEASYNANLVNEGFNRCINYVNGWTRYADPATGLIPRNLTDSRDYWNAWDAAADNYPFMVLTSSILMPDYYNKTAREMLETEKRLTIENRKPSGCIFIFKKRIPE